MGRVRLTAEDNAILWHGGFKAFGVDASFWGLTPFFTLLFTADTGDIAQDVSESAAEGVAFVLWHLQRFSGGVGESVACEAEILEHGNKLMNYSN